jgi:hypothetical protein
MVGSPEAVVAGAVGSGFAGQPERRWCDDGERRGRLTVAGEDVQNNGGGMDPIAERLGAGGLYGLEPVGQHGAEEIDHLAIAVRHAAELALDPPHRRRLFPVL